jgi:hypothetical protein
MYVGSTVAVNTIDGPNHAHVLEFSTESDAVAVQFKHNGATSTFISDELICLDHQDTRLMRANLIAAFDEVDKALCVDWHSNVPATLAPRSLWGKMRMS